MKRILSTLSPAYVKSWSRRDALREIVQNAIDAGGENTTWTDGLATISDAGPGLELRHLAMGLSEKRPDAIGQFGEGLKLALLVYAREGGQCRVYSNGHVITPRIAHHPDLDTDVLAFDIDESPEGHREGVKVVAECHQSELQWATSQFLATGPELDLTMEVAGTKVGLPGGRVYVNGQLVNEGTYHFTWLLTDRRAINRDRTLFSYSSFCTAVYDVCVYCTSVQFAREFLKVAVSAPACEEDNAHFYSDLTPKHFTKPDLWRRAIADIWGKKVCLTSKMHDADGQAEWEGWTVLIPKNAGWGRLLGAFLKTARQVITAEDTEHAVIPTYLLPQDRLAVLNSAVRRVEKAVLAEDYKLQGNVKIADGLRKNDMRVRGLYSAGLIYLDSDVLDSERDAVKTLFHESAHFITNGASDLSPGFIDAMERMATNLLLRGR